MLYNICLYFILFLFALSGYTQTIDSLQVRYFGTEKIDEMLRLQHEVVRKSEYTNGYRLQFAYSTSKEEVNAVKIECYKRFPQYRCYIIYEQPRYKLLVGDFQNRLDAYKAMMTVIADFPGAFIVKHRVLLKPF